MWKETRLVKLSKTHSLFSCCSDRRNYNNTNGPTGLPLSRPSSGTSLLGPGGAYNRSNSQQHPINTGPGLVGSYPSQQVQRPQTSLLGMANNAMNRPNTAAMNNNMNNGNFSNHYRMNNGGNNGMNTQQPVQGSLMGNPRAPMMQHNGPQSGPGLMNRPNNGSNMNLAGGGGLLNNPVRPMGMNSGNNGGIRPDWDGRSQHTMNSYNSGANPGPGLLNSYPMNNNAAAVAAAAAANMSSRNAQASSMQQSAPYQPYGSMPPQMAPNAAQNGSLLHQPPNMPYSGHMQQPATATPNHYQHQQQLVLGCWR